MILSYLCEYHVSSHRTLLSLLPSFLVRVRAYCPWIHGVCPHLEVCTLLFSLECFSSRPSHRSCLHWVLWKVTQKGCSRLYWLGFNQRSRISSRYLLPGINLCNCWNWLSKSKIHRPHKQERILGRPPENRLKLSSTEAREGRIPFFSQVNLSPALRPSTDSISPTQIIPDNLPYSKLTD